MGLSRIENFARSLFQFSGVVGRLQWWLTCIITWFFLQFSVIYLSYSSYLRGETWLTELLLGGVTLLALLLFSSVTIRRFRESGYSPWFIVSILVPVVGPLFILIICGFCPAKEGA